MEEDNNGPGPSNWRNRSANASRPWRPHNNRNAGQSHYRRVASNVDQRLNVPNRPIHIAPSTSQDDPMEGPRINREYKPRIIGFRTLEQLANENSNDILSKLNLMRDGFMNIINSPVDRLDVFVLVIRVLSKVSLSPFIDMKSKFILDVTKSNFVLSLRNYLMDLPYADRQSSNNLYWNNQTDFWKDLIEFCEQVYIVSPATATSKCRALIESVSKTCLDYLKQRHGFVLPQEHDVRLTALREKLTTFEEVTKSAEKKVSVGNQGPQPPEDFRELSLLPNVDDLLISKPFLRPNIVKGGYNDIQHYLDVQFRLLREDCFGPLRDGINQYLADPHKRKYDHVRVFQKVKFVCPYISNLKIGALIQLDTKDKNYFKRVNWAHSKRFLFGSLVIFTKDQCNSFVLGTILDRDVNLLSMGKLPVSLFNTEFDPKLYNEDSYTMIESEVYFEPYYHVMKALQARTFPENLPMQQYIVKVEPGYKHPGYLNNDTEFAIISNYQLLDDEVDGDTLDIDANQYMVELNENEIIKQDGDTRNKKFKVLQTNTWPNKDELEMNDSQYEAYQLALTHEFAVIQGPPGTGKTYVGIKVAKTLLANVKFKGCTMLIVCYTNHALDQFLEAISKVTKSIVRIGGQSRNEAMEKYNLTNLRKDRRLDKYFFEEKNILRRYVEELKEVLMLIDIFNNGVISCQEIEDDVADIKYLKLYFRHFDISPVKDPLYHWLFENLSEYMVDFGQCLLEIQSLNNHTDNDRSRNEIILEEDSHKKDYLKSINSLSSFSITLAKYQLTQLLATYNTTQDFSLKQSARDDILRICAEMNLYNEMVLRRHEVRLRIHSGTDFFKIPHKTRWCLYFMWINRKLQELNMKAVKLQTSVTPAVSTYEEARMMQDVQIIKERRAKVVGMTTSGAAKMRKLLQAIGPKIVIVEEAAEVLEQHIITSLTKDCQHLILIGDHQQLRPSASHMKLAKQYNIEVSLFERMITNGIHSRRLKVQHRMRPEIASLISPLIYPDLENHPSVEYFPNVTGIQCNLFFFTHNYKEEDMTANDSSSRTNKKEADLTLALANYIIQQGYNDEDVTILAAYSGQMFYMRKERCKYAALAKVKITVVDNYQGEESKIILLSLVRNNGESKIGFLGTENRICVALSRAKEGFFIFGNMDILKAKSELWIKIAATLENNGSLGDNLKLKCQNHPDQITTISSIDDFVKVPEGGCLQKCNFSYSCGHICLLYCHGYDREHVKTKCPEKCEKIICELQHVCPLRCRVECQPCQVMVLKTLPCQHEMKVACHLEPDDPRVKCRTMVEDTLPDCGHKTQKQCHIPINEIKCTERCVYRVRNCGHACQLFCHVKRDPDHEKYVCRKPCARAKKGCTANLEGDRGEHQCPKICFEECNDCNVLVVKKRSSCKHIEKVTCSTKIDETPCKMKCAKIMACGHFCKKKCFEPCGGCIIMVDKEIPDCKHKIKIECMKIPSRELCKAKCSRRMSCGHECGGVCGEACDASQCRAPTGRLVPAPCGHSVPLLCRLATNYDKGEVKPEDLLQYCEQPCGAVLACEHLCRGTCASCRQRRLHVPCTQTCNQIHICGHQCEEACNQICPPCNMMCEVECQHSRCNRRCGEPCIPCQEGCSRRCPHGACSRRCGEQCSAAACGAACGERLRCGHACRGLCGDPCPPVCATCSPDTFPTGFLGEEFGPENKFVLLQDCGHVLEVEDMDNLMMGDQDSVQIRRCPYCRKPIINTNRYKDLINNMLKNEINPIKTKVYGTKSQIKERKDYLNKQMTEFVKKYVTVIKGNPLLDQTLKNLFVFCKPQRRASLVEVEMLLVYLQYFDMITECCLKYTQIQTIHLRSEFQDHVKMLISGVLHIKNVRSKLAIKISQQQQIDVGKEIKRLNAIVQLSKILKWAEKLSTSGMITDGSNDLQLQIENVKKIVFAVSPFDENAAICAMQAIKLNEEVIHKYERAMVVKAIGLKAGHWYKCPNGHFYCIGECGGANQVGKCLECGAVIGGQSHALATGNAHAPEMDGSKFAAYSDAANNLANFDLNNIL